MWRLVKAEIADTKYSLIWLFLFIEMNFLLTAFLEQQKAVINPSVPQTITLLFLLYFFLKRQNEKRTRFHHILPQSLIQLSVARLFFPILFGLGSLTLYALSYYRFPVSGNPDILIWRVLIFSSLLISGNAAYSISFDLGNGFPEWHPAKRTIIISMVWLYVLGSVLLYWEPPVWEMMWKESLPAGIRFFYFTAPGSIILHLVSGGLCWLSVVVFKKRQVYLG